MTHNNASMTGHVTIAANNVDILTLFQTRDRNASRHLADPLVMASHVLLYGVNAASNRYARNVTNMQ